MQVGLAEEGILILAGRNGKKRKNVALRIGHSSGHTLGLRLGRIRLVSAFCVAGACGGQGEESYMNRTL